MSQAQETLTQSELIDAIHQFASASGTNDNAQASSIRMLANYLAQAVQQFAQGTTRLLNTEAWAISHGYDPNTNYLSNDNGEE